MSVLSDQRHTNKFLPQQPAQSARRLHGKKVVSVGRDVKKSDGRTVLLGNSVLMGIEQ